VTPTDAVIEFFKARKYDLLISHHPFPVRGIPMLIYHTALDNCLGGLNDIWKDFLDIKNAKHICQNLGWYGKIAPITFSSLVKKIEDFVGDKIQGFAASKKELIESVSFCSGLGGYIVDEALMTGSDAFITGELLHPSFNGFAAVIEVAHSRTEFQGVSVFRKLLPEIQVDGAPLSIDYFGNEVASKQQSIDRFV
jgi:putative NIF3 family GTP cyclohydrolase 1 type 2